MLSLRVKFLDIVSLVLVGYDELAGLLERNAMRLTSVVEKMSSADAKDRFERFRGVIEPWMIRGENEAPEAGGGKSDLHGPPQSYENCGVERVSFADRL